MLSSYTALLETSNNLFCAQRNRGILLGVVGTDIPVSELLKTIPKYKVTHV